MYNLQKCRIINRMFNKNKKIYLRGLTSSYTFFTSSVMGDVKFDRPSLNHAAEMFRIVKEGTLDTNSPYMYLLFCDHFRNESIGNMYYFFLFFFSFIC